MYLTRRRPAQSLLEAIIAIGVILVATISATTLIVVTISAGRVSADKIQAANFAREGVEVVRAIRDSNWMKRAQNICDGTAADCLSGAATTAQWDDSGSIADGYIPLSGTYAAKFNNVYQWSLVTYAGNEIIASRTPGVESFSQQCPSCTPTKFSRSIAITKITADALVTGDYLQVTSTVTWNSRGLKTLAMTERLYDWR